MTHAVDLPVCLLTTDDSFGISKSSYFCRLISCIILKKLLTKDLNSDLLRINELWKNCHKEHIFSSPSKRRKLASLIYESLLG